MVAPPLVLAAPPDFWPSRYISPDQNYRPCNIIPENKTQVEIFSKRIFVQCSFNLYFKHVSWLIFAKNLHYPFLSKSTIFTLNFFLVFKFITGDIIGIKNSGRVLFGSVRCLLNTGPQPRGGANYASLDIRMFLGHLVKIHTYMLRRPQKFCEIFTSLHRTKVR